MDIRSDKEFFSLFALLANHIELSDWQRSRILKESKVVRFSKNQTLVNYGESDTPFFFLNRGLCRKFLPGPKEVTDAFYDSGCFMFDAPSLLFKKQSPVSIEALEHVSAVAIPNALWNEIYTWEGGARLGLFIVNQCFIKLKATFDNYAHKDRLEILDNLKKDIPDIEARTTQRILATYMQITNTHLSRIKSTIAKQSNQEDGAANPKTV